MNNVRKQRGMTMVGWMMVLGLIAFFTLVGLKIGPLYMQFGTVSSVIDGMAEELRKEKMPKNEILKLIQRRFDVNDIKQVNAKEHVKIKRLKGGALEISIAYEARAPLFHNLSAVADFNKTVVVEGGDN